MLNLKAVKSNILSRFYASLYHILNVNSSIKGLL